VQKLDEVVARGRLELVLARVKLFRQLRKITGTLRTINPLQPEQSSGVVGKDRSRHRVLKW